MAAELILNVTQVGSGDVASNSSRVRIDLSITTTLGTWSHDGTTEGYIRFEGTEIDLNGKWVDINTTTQLYSGEHTVAHNADGTKTLTVEAGFNMNTTYTGWTYATKVLALTTIPRASTMKVPTFTIGAKGEISVNKSHKDFSHTITYTFGAKSGNVCKKEKSTTVSWTPDPTLANEIPDALSGTGTLKITTYNGSAKVGETKSYSFTANVPTSAVPTVKTLTVAPVNGNGKFKDWGVYIKGRTRIKYTITAEGAYGSSVNSYNFSCAGLSASGNGGPEITGTTAVISANAGSYTPTATVGDTRKRKSSAKSGSKITVYDYSVPSISSSYAKRTGADNTSIAVLCKATHSSVGGKNTLTVRYRTRPTGGSWSSYVTLTNGTEKTVSGFATNTSYDVEVSAVDTVGNVKKVVYNVPTEAVTFMLKDGGKSASFGKYPENSGLDMGWDIHMNSNRVTGLPPHTADSDAVPWADIKAYGLGGSKKITWSEIDSAQAPGWYHIAEENTICGHTASYWYMHVAAYSVGTAYCTQTLYSVSGDKTFERRQNNGTWGEWVNVSPSSYIKYDLLWSNASRTSSFAAQTITVDTTAYNFLAVEVAYNEKEMNGSEIRLVGMRKKNYGDTVATLTAHLITSTGSFNTVSRKLTIKSGRGSIVADGGIGSGGGASDTNAIPVKIYGVKGV